MSTAKERQAKRRAKIKANPELYKAQLEKDRQRKKLQRAAQREHQLKEQLRVKNYRSRTSMKPIGPRKTSQETPYLSRQALGKALKRLEYGLPSSPRKQRQFIKKGYLCCSRREDIFGAIFL